MNRSLTAGATLALVLLVGGCASSTPDDPPVTAAPPTTAATLEVEATMDVAVNSDGSVTVTSLANLPDGTEMNASIWTEGGYYAQDPQTLTGGQVTFGPFSDKGAPIPAGTYDVSVTMPIARNQPEAVKAVIGEHGENLTGPAVSADDLTGDAVVSIDEPLIIP